MSKTFAAALFLFAPAVLLAQPNVPFKDPYTEPGPIVTPDGEVLLTYREAQAMSTDAWRNAHKDIKYLLIGRKKFFNGDYAGALWNLDISAYFGDKLAQAMLAEMYWEGKGTKIDRVKAYALADVASERMNNAFFLNIREKYWNALSESERAKVPAIADEILARYSDDATTPRMEQHWRNSKADHRPKGTGRLLTYMIHYNYDTASAIDDVSPDAYYANKFWDAREYRTFKDKFTESATRYGTVRVQMGNTVQSSRVSTNDKSILDQIDVLEKDGEGEK